MPARMSPTATVANAVLRMRGLAISFRRNRKSGSRPNAASQPVFAQKMEGGWKTLAVDLAVVVTVTVNGFAVVPVTVIEEGLTLQVEAAGAPVQVNATGPENPDVPLRLRL